MSFSIVQGTLAADIATSGTLAVTYPTGTTRSDFLRGTGHVLFIGDTKLVSPTSFTVSLGATQATITYSGTSTLLAGSRFIFQLDKGGPDTYRDTPEARSAPARVSTMYNRLLNLGNPAAGSSTAICASQSVSSGVAAVLTLATLDVPRNVVAAWTGTAVLTVTGTDENGAVIVESSASGTSLTGAKAFKTITSVVPSASITSATVGTGNVLGLPLWLANSANVLKEFQDGAAPTAGTIVAGLSVGTKSTATTADVRGTYTPNATPDGSKVFQLLVSVADPNFTGNPQYAG